MALTWKGDELKRKTVRAARIAIDTTMAAAIQNARSGHGAGAHAQQRFVSRKGDLERGTKIVQPAKQQGGSIVGRWGVVGVAQARRIERGFQGKDSLGRSFNQPPFPYLRPAAEIEYPKLAGRIKRAAKFA
jgi:hypothetical protein